MIRTSRKKIIVSAITIIGLAVGILFYVKYISELRSERLRIPRKLYICNDNRKNLLVFDATEGGDVRPIEELRLPSARSGPHKISIAPHFGSISYDSVNNELYVTDVDNKSIVVYARNEQYRSFPVRTLFGVDPGIIAVDPIYNEIYVATGGASISIYDRSAHGKASPIRKISVLLTANPNDEGPDNIGGIAIDAHNDKLYLTYGSAGRIVVIERTASGLSKPVAEITRGYGGLCRPLAIAVDPETYEVFVADYAMDSSILIYKSITGTELAPSRVISGSNTMMHMPHGLAIDPHNDEIFIVNYYDKSWKNIVAVYNRSSVGNIHPIREISGPRTGLHNPVDIVIGY